MSLEKYVKNKQAEKPSESPIDKKTREALSRDLAQLRQFQRERYSRRRQEIIAKTKAETEKKPEQTEFSDGKIKSRQEKYSKERLSNYGEVLRDQKDMVASEFAFGEITSFEFNHEVFNGEGGWKEEYLSTGAKDELSMEEFVLKKQTDELNVIRETLMESRISQKISKIYPSLAEASKEEEKNKKSQEVTQNTKKFFLDNSEQIIKLLQEEEGSKTTQKAQLLNVYKSTVFEDLKLTDATAQEELNALFEDLLSDYEAMLLAIEKVKVLNPAIVELLNKNVTEEEWNEALAKEAEKQSKKLKEQENVAKQEATVMSGTPVDLDLNATYFAGISASEMIGTTSKIRIERVGPGEYRVLFPTEKGPQESRFSVRRIKENGKDVNIFVFRDLLLDRLAMVKDVAFRSQINGLYFEKAMNEIQRPRFNDILHDQQMYGLAEKLLYPKRLSDTVLTTEQTEVFKKMLILISGKPNNLAGEGIYGNLLAIRTRISLMEYVLSLDGGAKALSVFNKLKNTDLDLLRNMSVEKFCRELSVPANYGNFAK